MLQWVWFAMVAGSVLYSCLTGNAGKTVEAALDGCQKAIALTLQLGAGYLLFCGLMEIARAAKADKGLERLLKPVLKHLMPRTKTDEARSAAALNLSMNILGLGNAATPMGLEAMRRMEAEEGVCSGVKHDMYMLLILNATSLQLLPTTVLTLRAAAGSADVNAVLMPTLLCTAFSTLVGTALGLICRRWEERRHG